MKTLLAIGLMVPWLAAGVLALLPRRMDRHARALALVASLVTALALMAAWTQRGPTHALQAIAQITWLPEIGLQWQWAADGLTFMFLLLTGWISAVVVLFSWNYLPHAQREEGSNRREATFYALLSAFTGSMLGLVTSAQLLQFYVFWELTALASFLLIGFWHHHPAARAGATKSMVLTTAGSLLMLLGLLGMGFSLGAWGFEELLDRREQWPRLPWSGLWTGLIVAGALAKSAQMPFSAWLPAAMAAPTPASAFLHSSALVAGGIYLLARFFPILSAVTSWQWLLVSSGLVGGLLGGLVALKQDEIKAMLAYSTISQYAFIFLAFGLGSAAGAQAGLYAFFVHAFIKAGLFLVCGAVTYVTGEKRFAALGGLAGREPALAVLATVLALSLGGLPIFGGFYYKEELLHAALEQEAWLLLGSMLVGGGLTFLYMLRFFDEIFAGRAGATEQVVRLPRSMSIAIALLASVALLTGLAPNWMNRALLDPAISSVFQQPASFEVELELGALVLMSLGILALAAGLWNFSRHSRVPGRWLGNSPGHLDFGFRGVVRGYSYLSGRALGLHGGHLRQYLRWELMAAILLMAILWPSVTWGRGTSVGGFDAALSAMLVVMLLAAAATLWVRYHVQAIIALTISGYALAVVFALMHAPDVALAQVLVETLATFSIVAALVRSRQVQPQETQILSAGRLDWGRWAIALGLGGMVGWLTFWVGQQDPPRSIGATYALEGDRLTGWADLVTGILTDFRALDTVIEILVFATAALAIRALFRPAEVRHD